MILYLAKDLETSIVSFTSTRTARKHPIVETTSTPAVVECHEYRDALYEDGSCTLANAIRAAKAVLEAGLPGGE